MIKYAFHWKYPQTAKTATIIHQWLCRRWRIKDESAAAISRTCFTSIYFLRFSYVLITYFLKIINMFLKFQPFRFKAILFMLAYRRISKVNKSSVFKINLEYQNKCSCLFHPKNFSNINVFKVLDIYKESKIRDSLEKLL